MTHQYTVTIEEDPVTKDLILPFPTELISELKWEINDTLSFKQEGNSFVITNVSLEQRKLINS